jgi:hypothetical protein
LLLAAPRLAANVALMPGSAAVGLLETGALPTAPGLIRAIVAQTKSLDTLPEPGPHLDLAYLATALVESGTVAGDDRDAYQAVARHHVERALAMAPAQARRWFMLAGMRYDKDADPAGAAEALRLSFAADPHKPLMAPLRWPMFMLLRERMGILEWAQANAEFLTYFRLSPPSAVHIALRNDRLPELRALVADSEEDVPRLEDALQRLGQSGAAP